MLGLFDRDYLYLSTEELEEKKRIDDEGGNVVGAKFGRRNLFHKYPKAVRHNMTLFPNNYMDVAILKEVEELEHQCNLFSELLEDRSITELCIKRFIQDNKFYHIPASIFSRYNFGHHEAALFKEFQLGTSYKADYVLVGRASGGWEFVFVEFENPYGRVTIEEGRFGEVIRAGIYQIDSWKSFIEANFSTIAKEFEKYTNQDLSREFYNFDSSRMHYVVVAGRREHFSDNTRILQRRLEQEQNIKLLHYDNLLDDAMRLIGHQTY